jgi:hypothetical protein
MTALEAQPTTAQPQARLDLGRVVVRTFGAIGANFVTFFLLAILLAAIPNFLIGMGIGYLRVPILSQADPVTYNLVFSLLVLGTVVLGIIPTYVLIGALTQGSIVHYNGGKAGFGECLGTGFGFLLPLIGLGILAIIGLFLWLLVVFFPGAIVVGIAGAMFAQTGNFVGGGILGIVLGVAAWIPAVMAVIRWSVAAPSLVVERTGVMGAFKRSGNLTRNNRWAIFFLALIWLVISFGIQWSITFIGASTITGAGGAFVGAWLLWGFTILYSAINTMILGAGQAALYYELRVLKEGATSEELAKIFE